MDGIYCDLITLKILTGHDSRPFQICPSKVELVNRWRTNETSEDTFYPRSHSCPLLTSLRQARRWRFQTKLRWWGPYKISWRSLSKPKGFTPQRPGPIEYLTQETLHKSRSQSCTTRQRSPRHLQLS